MPSHMRLAAFVTAVSAGGWMMNAGLSAEQPQESSFGSVVEQVNSLHEVVVLSSAGKQALVAVCPALQGRVLTSSAGGANAPGFGWVNMPLIQAGKAQPHFNAYGGEDRLWLGPEGGQYSIFFAPGAPFELDHWYTPAPFDTEPFELVKRSAGAVSLQKRFALVNDSGTRFDVQIDREVTLLSAAQIWAELHADPE